MNKPLDLTKQEKDITLYDKDNQPKYKITIQFNTVLPEVIKYGNDLYLLKEGKYILVSYYVHVN